MLIFKQVSPENTPTAIKLALEKAKEMETDIVLSTTTGDSAFTTSKLALEMDYTGRIIAVTHAWGVKNPGENSLSDENRKKLTDAGMILVTAAHTLSGVERGFSGKFGGIYPVEIMAHTLRMFSQGVKVCVEISVMALDAGTIRDPRAVVALGGTGPKGLDTVCVITPGYSAKIFETRIHEILSKPY